MTVQKKTFTFRGLILLLIPMIALTAFGFYHRKEAMVCRVVQQELEKRFPEWNIRMDSARLVESRGVRLRDLKFSLPLGDGEERPFLEADEIFIQAPITVAALFRNDVRPQRIVLTHPVLHLNNKTLDEFKRLADRDGNLDFDKLLCPLEIVGGSVALTASVGVASNAPISLFCPGINATLTPPSTNQENPLWRLAGQCQNPFVKDIRFSGTATPDGSDWRLSGKVDSMEMEPRVFASLVADSRFTGLLESFQGRTSLSFAFRKDERASQGFHYQLDGEIFRGSLVSSFLDHPVSDLFVRYHLCDNQLDVERLTARSGPVLILARYLQNGFGRGKTFTMKAQLEELPLNEKFLAKFSSLPTPLRQWTNGAVFSTTAKVNLTLEGKGEKITPTEVSVQCRHLTVGHDSLPFRIEQLDGALALDETGRLRFDFQSDNEHRVIHVVGDYQDVLGNYTGSARFEATRIPIDEQLLDALPEACRNEIRALHPTGLLDALVTFHCSDSEANHPEIKIALGVREGTIRYERFPFPISQISGKIACADGKWTFTDFHGSGASAELSASGKLLPFTGGEGRELILDLKLNRFPLGDEFREALTSPYQKELVEKLHLRGRSNADVRLRYLSSTDQFDLEFEAFPIAEETSIQPDHFPYELSGLEGEIIYRDGNIIIPDLRGKNGSMAFSASIDCHFSPENGECSLKLAPFTIDELLIDRRLQNAVPSQFLTFLDQVSLAGYFNASGSIEFYRPSADAPTEAVWDSEIVLHQNSAQCGKEVSGICGKTILRGIAHGPDSLLLHGELDLDSLCVGDVQVTRLTGPFYFDGRQVLFGKSVPPLIELPLYQNAFLKKQLFSQSPYLSSGGATLNSFSDRHPIIRSQSVEKTKNNEKENPPRVASLTPIANSMVDVSAPFPLSATTINAAPEKSTIVNIMAPRSLSGDLFHGLGTLNGTIQLTTPMTYRLDFNLQEGRLDEIMRDLTDQSQRLQGRVSTFVKLQGEGKNLGTLKGNGGLALKDAELYELPLMIQILRSLSVNEPDQTAFETGFIDFQVFGNRLQLNRVLMEGDSLTLFGDGWLTIEGNDPKIDLTMNSRLGNVRNQIPLVSDVIGGAGDQIAQIKIEGPLSEASIRQDRFPGIKKAVWSIFPDPKKEKSGK